MKRLAFAVGLLAFGFTAASPARADFAVVEFNSGYCRVWTDTVFGPEDGHYLWFLSPSLGWRYRFLTFEGADAAMHQAVAMPCRVRVRFRRRDRARCSSRLHDGK